MVSHPSSTAIPGRTHPALVGGLLVLLAANVALPLLYGRLPGARFLDYGSVLILAFWAAVLAWHRGLHQGPRAFLLLGLGAAFGGLRYLPTLLGLPGAAILGPALSLLGLLALGAGFLTWPRQVRLRRDRFRTSLDGLALAISLFTVAWMVLEPADRVGALSGGMLQIYLVQLSVCVGVLALWLLQETRLVLPQQGRAKGLVRAALLALLAHSSLGTLLRTTGHYYPGYLGHATEVLHQVANALLALAAVSIDPAPEAKPATPPVSTFRALIPSGVTLVVLVLAVLQVLRVGPDGSLVLGGLILTLLGLLALRHSLQILDLEALSRDLEGRVEARTRALEAHHEQAMGDLRMRMMAGLAAGLAHDLNNILGIIRLRVELLKETGTPGQREDLQVLEEASERAITLSRRILASGRSQTLRPESLDLRVWLTARRDFLRALLHPGQRLNMELEAGGTAHVDAQSLEQVLENLVTNARDAMGPDGCLTLRLAGDPGRLRLELQDDGPGIPSEVLPHLFEPFFTTKDRGTGLGLPTVRNLVLQNRGSILVQSQEGQGTTVHLEFPTAPDQSQGAC